MSTPAGYAFALILFFGRGRGRGGRATAKPTGSRRTSADGFAVKMKRTKAGAGLSNPVPRFRRRNGNGKNPDSQGFKSGDFFAPCAKKYYSSLDGLDSRNGHRTGIVCSRKMCYTWVSKLTDKVIFRGRIMARRKKLGDIVEIPLSDGRNAYARLYKEYTLGIYKGTYSSYDDVPEDADFFRFICVYRSSLSKLQVVGSKPFANDEDSWAPDKVVVDAITGRGSLYHHGEILKCTYVKEPVFP